MLDIEAFRSDGAHWIRHTLSDASPLADIDPRGDHVTLLRNFYRTLAATDQRAFRRALRTAIGEWSPTVDDLAAIERLAFLAARIRASSSASPLADAARRLILDSELRSDNQDLLEILVGVIAGFASVATARAKLESLFFLPEYPPSLAAVALNALAKAEPNRFTAFVERFAQLAPGAVPDGVPRLWANGFFRGVPVSLVRKKAPQLSTAARDLIYGWLALFLDDDLILAQDGVFRKSGADSEPVLSEPTFEELASIYRLQRAREQREPPIRRFIGTANEVN